MIQGSGVESLGFGVQVQGPSCGAQTAKYEVAVSYSE